jgi:tRNA(Arg) A34 adenosine deaminase TadA
VDHTFRVAARKLDHQHLGLEERIEETLKMLQHWEIEHLRAVKTVLLQYQGTLSNLLRSLEPSLECSGTLIAAYLPDRLLLTTSTSLTS